MVVQRTSVVRRKSTRGGSCEEPRIPSGPFVRTQAALISASQQGAERGALSDPTALNGSIVRKMYSQRAQGGISLPTARYRLRSDQLYILSVHT